MICKHIIHYTYIHTYTLGVLISFKVITVLLVGEKEPFITHYRPKRSDSIYTKYKEHNQEVDVLPPLFTKCPLSKSYSLQ